MDHPRPNDPLDRTSADPADVTQPSDSPEDSMHATQGYEDTVAATPTQPTAKSQKAPAPREKLTKLGEFQLTKKLGAGGMGVVYKAHQTSLDRPVALKVLAKHLAANPAFVDRFRREARTMARLDHTNIVRGYAVGEERGWHYFAMEFIDGKTMEDWVAKLGKIGLGDALHIVQRCAEALCYAHERQLVHRDIKPGNILVTSDGTVKIADLGLAKALDEDMSLTQSGMGMGTPYYMPPEQARNAKHVDGRSDLYALGATLYHLLTGKAPFSGETTLEVLEAKQKGEFPPARRINPEVPERLDLVLDKTLAPDPDHRYQTCDELLTDLRSVATSNETLSFLQSATEPEKKQPGKIATKGTLKTTAAASKTAVQTEPVWYVRHPNNEGQEKVHKLSHKAVKDLIRGGRLDSSTQASRRRSGPFQSLGSYSELAKTFQRHNVQTQVDRQAEKYNKLYEDIYRQERRQRIWKFISHYLRGIVGWTVILGILALLIFLGVRYGLPWIMGNAQSYSESFQEKFSR